MGKGIQSTIPIYCDRDTFTEISRVSLPRALRSPLVPI